MNERMRNEWRCFLPTGLNGVVLARTLPAGPETRPLEFVIFFLLTASSSPAPHFSRCFLRARNCAEHFSCNCYTSDLEKQKLGGPGGLRW